MAQWFTCQMQQLKAFLESRFFDEIKKQYFKELEANFFEDVDWAYTAWAQLPVPDDYVYIDTDIKSGEGLHDGKSK